MEESSDDAGRFARLKRIVTEARGRSGPDRGRYLDEACGGDASLRDDAERLLAAYGSDPDLDAGTAAMLGDEGLPATVDVGGDGDGDAASWEAYLDQLRRRAVNWERYVDEGEVARGGMGAIRRVFDRDARRRLALKVMLDARAAGTPAESDASLGRFLEEAQVTSQLEHPGIVPVHEIGVDDADRVYFTMKLVRGEDLRSVFDRVADPSDEEWTTTRALNVMLRVCEAMAYAHAKGVIHRDLKPGNVMVGRYGEAYVMDWGLAKVLGREDKHDLRLQPGTTESLRTERRDAAGETPDSPILTMDGAVVGTPAYMPPEQAEGRVENLGPPADVYAVGAMLYHLLAGRMPYVKPGARVSPRTILALVTQGPPAPLSERAPDVPAELAAIVEKAMAREIEDRYPDMTALAQDLRAFLEHRVVAAYETGAWAEARKWVQRNKALAGTAAAAVVGILAVAGWALVERRTARENERVALANEAAAEAERDRVLRLSDKRRLDVMLSEADALWPAHPENVAGMKRWLDRAEGLLGNLPLHAATLAEVRSEGTPLPHPREAELAGLREHLAKHAAGEEVEGEALDDEEARAEHVAALDASVAALEATIARERDHDFGEDADARWWHDAVRDLVLGLDALEDEDVHGPTVVGIEARLAWAETVAERTTTGPDVAAQWAEAREAIRAHPKYAGLDLKPQLGLVPLGPDPASTLWEFGHLQTGDLAVRDPETRKLAITEETGLVFVLISGGTFRVGAQKEDEDAPHHDPQASSDESPVHEVTLSPYLLSKVEMTQGQWARFTGNNPGWWMASYANSTSLAHPVENVSWEMCRETLDRLGLVLPTEAQWEAACRAGTESAWSFGDDVTAFPERGNVRDAKYAKSFSGTDPASCESFDDGHGPPAEVGTLQANGFGLHDTHGNVWEWCRDGYGAYTTGVQAGDALRVQRGATYRVARGGSCYARAINARSANRDRSTPELRSNDLGCRPARGLSFD